MGIALLRELRPPVGREPVVACESCGHPLPADAQFCASCGKPAGDAEEVDETTPEEPPVEEPPVAHAAEPAADSWER